MPVSLAVLVQCPLFADVPAVSLGTVAERMRLVPLRRREVLGGAAGFKGLGVVLSGSMQAVEEAADGREVVLASAEVNQPFGLAELLAEGVPPAVWMAGSSSTAVGVLERAEALELFKRPDLAWPAARSLARRVCDMQGMQRVLSIHSVPARLATWLHWQCGGCDGQLKLPTHAELAWQLNTTRESVTRILQRLSGDGLVARQGDSWNIRNADALLVWGQSVPRDE